MSGINKICLWCWRKFIVLTALLVILLALIFSAIRLAMPLLSDWKSELESIATNKIGYQVNIESINVSWHKLYPRAHLVNTVVNDDKKRLFYIGELIFSIDVIRSLLSLDLKLKKVTIVNTNFHLLRDKNNKWYLNKQLLNKNNDIEEKIHIPEKFQNIILTALNSRLLFKDEIENKEHLFDDLSVSAINSENRYQLYISSEMPSSLGRSFDVGIDVNGDINQVDTFKGQAYIGAKEIDIKTLLPWLKNIQPIEKGLLSGQFWFEIGSKKQEFVAQLQADKVKINTKKIKDKAFSNIKAEFDRIEVAGLFRKNLNKYQAYLPLVKFVDKQEEEASVFSDGLSLSISTINDSLSEVKRFRVSYDEVSLETMQKIITLLPASSLKKQLKQIKLLGFIKNGFIDCQNVGTMIGCSGKSYFDKINYSTGKNKPSLLGFSGEVVYRDNMFYAKSSSENITVSLPGLFVKPVAISSLGVEAWVDFKNNHYVIRNAQALMSETNLDFEMDIDIARQGEEYDMENSRIRLLANANNVIATDVSTYLPLKKMHPALKKWLEGAFKGGKVKSGSAIVNSTFEDYKVNPRNTWQINAKGESIDLQFDSKWPLIEKISGDLLITNNGLLLNAKRAEMLNMPISTSYVWLDNYKQSALNVEMEAAGELSGLLDLVKSSPLSKGTESVWSNISVEGKQNITIDLEIPLYNIRSLMLDALVEIESAKIHEKITDVYIENIPTGKKLYISEEAFVVDRFEALFNKNKADFDISTSPNVETGLVATNMRVLAMLPSKDFWPDHSAATPAWLNDVRGKSNYNINLYLPINARQVKAKHSLPKDEIYPVVSVKTDLIGTNLAFLAPLYKVSSQKNDVLVQMLLLPDNEVYTEFFVDEIVRGEINSDFEGGELKINSAEVAFNENEKSFMDITNGVFLRGSLHSINIDDWLDYLDSVSAKNQDSTVLDLIRSVDLEIDSLYYLGRNLKNVKTVVQQQPQDWLIDLNNTALKGEISLPKKDIVEQGIRVRFDYLNFNELPSDNVENQSVIDPKTFPALQASIGRLQIKDYVFDNVEVRSSRTLHGIKIDSVTVNNPSLSIDLQGSWINLPDGSTETSVAGKLSSENLGEGLQSLGYAKLIKDGYGGVDFSFHWPNSPADIAIDKIVGKTKGIFEKGEVLALDPGSTGRLFSLISLNQLPKRLLFNFKDVDAKGYYFRKLSGDFNFANGIAETDNFRMRSSIGKIYIEGKTDLINETYDQKLRFLPDLSATLPVVGTILGGGNTGVGILVLDGVARLFGKQLDNIGEKKYTITGTWDKPVIKNKDKKLTVETVTDTP